MADIYLRASNAPAVTCISNSFIDEYMRDANGEYVKIYLYLMRCLSQEGMDFSISAMADKLEYTEKDIRRALAYWEKAHLLQLEYDEAGDVKGICVLNPHVAPAPAALVPAASPAVSASAPAALVPAASPAVPASASPAVLASASPAVPASAPDAPCEPRTYSPEELDALRRNEEIRELLFISEKYLGRTLTMTDMNSILYWYEGLGLSADVIEYLVEYCVERGHTSIRYMEKVAQGWADSHISTVEEAKASANIHSQTTYSIMKSFGISGRNLLESEIQYIQKWTDTYGFTLDIINEACRRTIRNIQKPNFGYADTILTSWHENHIHHLEDIARLDRAHTAAGKKDTAPKNRFHNFSQRSYDYDVLEKQLLQQ